MKHLSKYIKSGMPFFTAILVFVMVTFAYLHPLLEGKQIEQHDIAMFKGMSKEISDFRERTGEEALWTNSMFGGMPAWQISVVYTGNLIRHVKKIVNLGMSYPASTVFMYFFGFYILLLVMRVDPWLSIAGALAFGFSSYFFIILNAGHSSKAIAIGYMAPVIAGIILAFRGKYAEGGLLTAIALALQLEANHLQITYYLMLLVIIIGLFQLIDAIRFKTLPRFAKAMAVLIPAALVAALTVGTNLYATWEYGKESMRGKPVLTKNVEDQTKGLDRSYITHWSYGIGETWSLLIPNAKGGATKAIGSDHPALDHASREFRRALAQQNAYWGDQPGTSGPVYTGAIVVFLFVLGLFVVKGKYKWILLAGTILSIMLSWGRNFMPFTDFFLDYVPGYDKFRAVSMTLVIADLTMPLLGFLALWEVYKNPQILGNKNKWLYIAFGLTGGLALIFYMLPSVFFNFFSQYELEQFARLRQDSPSDAGQINLFMQELEKVRIAIFRKDAIRSFFFITLAAAMVLAYSRHKLKANWLTAGITLLILLDMVPIDTRYLNSGDFIPRRKFENPFEASTANREIMQRQQPNERVLDLTNSTFNDASASYFHHSIGGYHGAKLQRYQDLIEHHLQAEISTLARTLNDSPNLSAIDQTMRNWQALNMLNTRYIIFNPNASPIINIHAYGDAWPVKSLVWVDNPNDEIDAIANHPLNEVAIVNREFAPLLTGLRETAEAKGKIELMEYEPNHLIYSANLETEALVVFSQIWYTAGWKAFVNGQEQPLIRANYVLRALRLPAGESKVEMRFEPKVWKTGQAVSLASSGLLILLLLVWIVMQVKQLARSEA
ncbi:MAG TPA: YfhO family protein [Bacteroidales bacterium]|nr:YfhO family protein [Bacteroidales bacterium]